MVRGREARIAGDSRRAPSLPATAPIRSGMAPCRDQRDLLRSDRRERVHRRAVRRAQSALQARRAYGAGKLSVWLSMANKPIYRSLDALVPVEKALAEADAGL